MITYKNIIINVVNKYNTGTSTTTRIHNIVIFFLDKRTTRTLDI